MTDYTWLSPAAISGICLLAVPVVLAVAWLTWVAAHRPRSDDWQDDGNRRPRRGRR